MWAVIQKEREAAQKKKLARDPALNTQYRVQAGAFLRVEKLALKPGDRWKCPVLLLAESPDMIHIGTPLVEKAWVQALVLGHGQGKKTLVFKKKRRKGYRLTQGHRQAFTSIYIESINAPSGKKSHQPLSKKGVKKSKAPRAAGKKTALNSSQKPRSKDLMKNKTGSLSSGDVSAKKPDKNTLAATSSEVPEKKGGNFKGRDIKNLQQKLPPQKKKTDN